MSNKQKNNIAKTKTQSPKSGFRIDKKVLRIAIPAAIALVLVTVILIVTLFSTKHHFKFENGELIDRGGTVYKMVPTNYRPTSYKTDEKYAILEHPIFGDINLYEVDGGNGAWIYCTEDALLYRRENVSLPTLEMMEPTAIMLSTNGSRELSVAVTSDAEIIEHYMLLISDEANSVEDPGINPTSTYKLSFRSEEYSYLMYTVSYFEYGDDLFLIYDRTTGLYYPCKDDFYKLLQGADLETGTESGDGENVTPESGEQV